ncbi:MAG TPA: (Fe-S)-binding protein [Gammaproteobacteria bacterium]|nr:(Fe-S)-binding protein [Gammaproteobacteria bacterium]
MNLHAPLPANDHTQARNIDLAAEIDRCVLCGMCSQHCPTYAIRADENESPRGRIALIAALAAKQIAADTTMQAHLRHCTGCRACEASCPSGVRFGAIMDAARAMLPRQDPPSLPSQQHIRWLRLYQRTGLQHLARASGLLKPLGLAQKDNLLPPIPDTPSWQAYYPATPGAEPRGDVALFTGCIANTFDRKALEASRHLLNTLGYGVHVPPGQDCCGALALHNGRPDEATQLARQNLETFAKLDVQAIVHTASGCSATLSEYHRQLPGTETFSRKVKDISQFLAEVEWPAAVAIAPLPKTIALHTPCSLQNVLRQAEAPRRLLQRIPRLEIVPLAPNTRCCGGAGRYMLEQADFAQGLRAKTLDAFARVQAQQEIDTLITSNLGCALHLAAGLRERGQDVEVVHPVVLLARQVEALRA